MAPFLEIARAEVSYTHVPVLRGVSVAVERGSCLVLLGPSGCGKTTLLNVVAGFTRLDRGWFSCAGSVMDDPAAGVFLEPSRRNFATVFQDFSLWPHMTVAENVAFGLKVKGVPREKRERRTRSALDKVRMASFADRYPAALSGGQQQRVAIARALAVQPAVLLLDEPLSALDAKLREELRIELSRLLREEGQTALYVTHDQSEALTLGDAVAVMREGRIEQLDSPENLYRFPKTRFVAEFIGSANTARFEQRENRLVIGENLALAAREDWPARGWCFIRREGVHIRPVAENSKEIAICADRRFLGSRVEAVVEWPDGFTLVGEAIGPLNRGDRVCLEIDPAYMGLLMDSV